MKLSTLADVDVSSADLEVADPEVIGLTADSREVRAGFLFAALKGVGADGRDFIPDAIRRGAVAVLGPPGLTVEGVAYVADPEPRRKLARMAARLHPRQPETIVAVTGTNGKSSTVDFLRQIWAAAGRASASLGTLGIADSRGRRPLAHTTPDPVTIHAALDRLAGEGVTHLALEASSHGMAQRRLDAVRIGAAAFTNLTQDHFDYHPSFEDYFAAKARLFTQLGERSPGAPAVINPEGAWGARMVKVAHDAGLDVRTFGWSGEAVQLAELWPRAAGQRLDLKIEGKEHRVELPLVGEFQALNALGAAALALATGVPGEVVLASLRELQGVPGRLQLAAQSREGSPIFIDYAHTPDGLDKLLRALRPHTQGRVILVFGCGGDRDPTKRTPMGAVAAKLADIAIVTDDNPRSERPEHIRAAIRRGAPDALEIGDRAAAIAEAVGMLKAGDALVIAGKGHETGQIIGDQVIPFHDAEEAAKAARAKGAG